jgi:hypothetical protein
MSMSQEWGSKANHIPRVASLDVSTAPRLLKSSTSRPQNGANEPGMSMKTNGKDNMSLTRIHDFARSPLRV